MQFGKRKVYSAVVARVHDQQPRDYQVKEILDVLDERPVVTASQLEFWYWMADYYCCSIGEVMAAALPASLEGADRVFCYSGGVGWDVAEALAPLGERATVLKDLSDVVDAIVAESRAGDRVVVMSNGGFGGIHTRLLDRLRDRPGRAA